MKPTVEELLGMPFEQVKDHVATALAEHGGIPCHQAYAVLTLYERHVVEDVQHRVVSLLLRKAYRRVRAEDKRRAALTEVLSLLLSRKAWQTAKLRHAVRREADAS